MSSNHSAPHKPAELFRSDLISAMKLPDSYPLESSSFVTIKEPWRTEWEVGVQVCVSPDHILEASARTVDNPPTPSEDYECAQRYLHEDEESNDYVMYDLDELDLNWLHSVNSKRKFKALAGSKGLEEDTLRESLLFLETKCQQGMARAVATEDTLGIEYDEQTMCDVCRDQESEDSNDIIFCDSCNLCVHQACYGVPSIPTGEWLCRPCAAGEENPSCVLCPVKGGALKKVRPGTASWAHLCCALWIPEVRVGNAEKMEPITNVDAIPPSRRNLMCCICRSRHGACIRCSHPTCAAGYHVTCGFQHGLEMRSRLNLLSNAVIHESYCPKHTAMKSSPNKTSFYSPLHGSSSTGGAVENKPSQLVQLQEQFYNYASAEDLTEKFKLSPKLSILIYNYWKLKRKFQHNRPLLSHLPIETSLESIKAELAAGGIKYGMDVDESFLKIVHIRQNLEKARNLVYMVQRRERLKKQLLLVQSERLQLEASLLHSSMEETDEEGGVREAKRGSVAAVAATTTTTTTTTTGVTSDRRARNRSCSTSHRGSSPDTDEEFTVRKTRSMTQQGSGVPGIVTSQLTPATPTTTSGSSHTTSIRHEHNNNNQSIQQRHPPQQQQQQQQSHQVTLSSQHQKQQESTHHANRQPMTNGSTTVQSVDGQRSNSSLCRENRTSRTPSGGRVARADNPGIHRKELKKELRMAASRPPLSNAAEPTVMEPRVTRSSAMGRSVDSGSSSNEDDVSGPTSMSMLEPRVTRSSAVSRPVDSGSSSNEDDASGAIFNLEPSLMEPRVTRSSTMGRTIDSGSSSNEDEATGARHHRSGIIIGRGENMTSVRDRQLFAVNGKTMMNGTIAKLDCARELCATQQTLGCRKASLEASNFRMKPTCNLKDSALILPRNRTAINLRIRPYNINHRGSGTNKS